MPTRAYAPEVGGPVSLSPAAIDACPPLERRLEAADLMRLPWGDRAFGDRHPTLAQAAVDLGHAAVLAVAPRADQGDHVEAELVLRQHDRTLGLRPWTRRCPGHHRSPSTTSS